MQYSLGRFPQLIKVGHYTGQPRTRIVLALHGVSYTKIAGDLRERNSKCIVLYEGARVCCEKDGVKKYYHARRAKHNNTLVLEEYHHKQT